MLTIFLLLTQASPASAQTPAVTIESRPSCGRCGITVQRVMRLGDREGDGAFASRPYVAARDSRGRFYIVTPETNQEPPFVFDRTGRFLQRLGRVGDGPGEYREPISIMVRRDSVYVLDRQQGRMTVLSPGWGYVRSFQAPTGGWSAAALDSGGFVINARIRDASRIGIPLHLFDHSGNYLRSMGDRRERIDPRNNSIDSWWVSAGQHNTFWSTPYSHRYVLNHWDARGRLLQSLVRRADWFPTFDSLWIITPTRPPYPILMGSWTDAEGLVWVIAGVSDPRWQRGLGAKRRGEGGVDIYRHEDRQKLYDTLIEVIDPVRGTLVTSRRLDETLDVVIGSGLVGGVRETDDGVFLDVVQLSLSKSSP